MEIQEVITHLSGVIAYLSEIKMEKLKGNLTDREAKKKCAVILRNSNIEDFIKKAIKDWK